MLEYENLKSAAIGIVSDLIEEIIKSEKIESQQRMKEALDKRGILTTQANIKYHFDRMGIYKKDGIYRMPQKKIDFKNQIKDLIVKKRIKNEKLHLFCLKDSAVLLMNIISQNYEQDDLSFTISNSQEYEILTIDPQYSGTSFEAFIENINKIIG